MYKLERDDGDQLATCSPDFFPLFLLHFGLGVYVGVRSEARKPYKESTCKREKHDHENVECDFLLISNFYFKNISIF